MGNIDNVVDIYLIILPFFLWWLEYTYGTLTHGYLKVHGGVPIVLCMFVDPLYPRINCIVFREYLIALFLSSESWSSGHDSWFKCQPICDFTHSWTFIKYLCLHIRSHDKPIFYLISNCLNKKNTMVGTPDNEKRILHTWNKQSRNRCG